MPSHGFQTQFQGLHDAQLYVPNPHNHVVRKKLIQHALRKIPGIKPHLSVLHYTAQPQKTKDPHMQDLHYNGPKFNNNK